MTSSAEATLQRRTRTRPDFPLPPTYQSVNRSEPESTYELDSVIDDIVVELDDGFSLQSHSKLRRLSALANKTRQTVHSVWDSGRFTLVRKVVTFLWGAIVTIMLVASLRSQAQSVGSGLDTHTTAGVSLSKNTDVCNDKHYLERTVKTQWEAPIGGLLTELHDTDKFEASAVAFDRQRNVFWVAFDSLTALGRFDHSLVRGPPPKNMLVPAIDDADDSFGDDHSGFEGVTLDELSDSLYLLKKATNFVAEAGGTWHSAIEHISLSAIDANGGVFYNVSSDCLVDFPLPTDCEGFKSLQIVHVFSNNAPQPTDSFFLMLCTGNNCNGGKKTKDDTGNGMFHVFDTQPVFDEKYAEYGYECYYALRESSSLRVPQSVDSHGHHYAGFNVRHMHTGMYNVAVLSPESSGFWVTQLDAQSLEFEDDDSEMYSFSRSSECKVEYCNVKGLAFIDERTLVGVSDKAKATGKQQFQCQSKDQSLHIFQIQSFE